MSNQPNAIGSVPNAADHYRNHTISKGVAVAMLVTTLVAAALAIYFGHQAWQAGVNFSGNIPHLMASIPFDVTFLIGCASTVVGIAATIYSIYHYVQKEKLLPPIETEEPKDLEGPQGAPEAKEAPGPMNTQSYAQLAYAVGQKLNGSQQPTESELRQLADNYPLMLRTLPNIPEPVVKCVVANLYENGKAREFKDAVSRAIEDSIGEAGRALSNLIDNLKEQETDGLIVCIGVQLSNSGMDKDLRDRVLPGVKDFIWNLAANNLRADYDTFYLEVHNKIDPLMVKLGLVSNKNKLSNAIMYLHRQQLLACVEEIEDLKKKLS